MGSFETKKWLARRNWLTFYCVYNYIYIHICLIKNNFRFIDSLDYSNVSNPQKINSFFPLWVISFHLRLLNDACRMFNPKLPWVCYCKVLVDKPLNIHTHAETHYVCLTMYVCVVNDAMYRQLVLHSLSWFSLIVRKPAWLQMLMRHYINSLYINHSISITVHPLY